MLVETGRICSNSSWHEDASQGKMPTSFHLYPPMSDPWQILSLSRMEATEKDVKAAYAKLIKVHRPDSDPEGFQRVRAAYESALEELRNGFPDFPGEPLSWVANPEDVPESPREALPPEVTLATDHLREMVKIGHRDGLATALGALSDAARKARSPAHTVGHLVLEIFEGCLPQWITAIPMDFIFDLVLEGDIRFAHAAFESWWEAGAFQRGKELAEKLLQMAPSMVGDEMGMILAAAGVYCGFWYPNLARDLGQAAFRLIRSDSRDNVLQQLDQQVMLGRLFETIPFEQRIFWRERLRAPDVNSWNTTQGKEVIATALQAVGAQWPAWNLVHDQLPGWVRSRLQERLNSAPSRPRKSGSPIRYAWLVLLLASFGIRTLASLFGGSNSSSTPSYHYNNTSNDDVKKGMDRYLELQKQSPKPMTFPSAPPAFNLRPTTTAPWPTGTPSAIGPNAITQPFQNPLVTPPLPLPLPPPSDSSSSHMPDLSHWQNPRH